jgi:hypothetical protein
MKSIKNEIEFEEHIRNDILPIAIPNIKNYKLFNFKKAVDILIAKNGIDPKLFFIEIKYHKKRHGRLGFGQSKGLGFQPEVLKEKTDYFESNLFWILGNEDSQMYWLANNDLIRKYVSGNKVGEKYNNIQTKFFDEVEPLSKTELISNIKLWLQS